MSEYRQGKGSFKAGSTPTDYSSEVIRATPVLTTSTETLPATLGNDEEDEVGGALKRSLEIEFLEDRAADSFWAELKAAYESATQELAIEYNTDSTTPTASADTPTYSFTVRVTNLRLAAAAVGKVKTQTITVPIKAGTWSESTGA